MLKKDIYNRYGIRVRLISESDAEFILALRQGERARFLSKTEGDVETQREWIRNYKQREEDGVEFYFVAEDEDGTRYGTTRLYNFDATSFTTGSWLFSKDAPQGMAIKTDIIGREIAFEELGFTLCRFDVMKDNKSVIRYHMGYRPRVIHEDEHSLYFELGKEDFYKYKERLLKLFGHGNK